MHKARWAAAALLTLALTVAACARQTPAPPPAEAPPKGEAPQAPAPPPAKPKAPREEALARMAAGDLEGAVPLWREAVAQSPTADNWNDLSYTYLLLGRWKDAVGAAEEALKLQPKHPGALYNAGVARLELHQPAWALGTLEESAVLQPDRYEPYLAMARAHAMLGNYALARYHLTQAERLKAKPAEVEPVRAQVARLAESGVAAPAKCTVMHDAYPLVLCFVGKDRSSITDLYAGKLGGKLTRISLGKITVTGRIVQVALPGGMTGFLVEGDETGAYVSGSREWRLFAVSATEVHQVVFTGNRDHFLATFSDYIRSIRQPEVKGDELTASYGNDASREAGAIVVKRRLLPDHTAVTLSLERVKGDPNK